VRSILGRTDTVELEMEGYDVHLGLVGYEKPGRIPHRSGEEARLICERYEDEGCRRREGVTSCWVTKTGDSLPLRGTAPENWSCDSPAYENATPAR